MSSFQSFTVAENTATVVSAVDNARDHIEADLHAEMRAIRVDLAELKRMLLDSEAG